MQTTSLFDAMISAFARRADALPPIPIARDWRAQFLSPGPGKRRRWTPARKHAETAACARRRGQIAAGRLTTANGLVLVAAVSGV